MKVLRNILIGFVYALPAALFFSYHPVIKIGENYSMNFELSLSLIWLVLFDILVVIYLVLLGLQQRKQKQKSPQASRGGRNTKNSARYTRLGFNFPGISDRRIFLLSLFPFFATLSVFWSANPFRALLTAGIIWLIFLAIFALLYLFPLLELPKHFARNLLRSFFAASLFVCVVCWLQSFLDILSVGRDQTLLCLGCTYHSFGFPHPSGFAIEPQFMGNLLLAPTLTALYLLTSEYGREITLFSRGSGVTTRKSGATLRRQASRTRLEKMQVIYLSILAFIFSATLFLTFSRGAIYAYAVGLIILFVFALRRSGAWHFVLVIPVLTFAFVLGVQGMFSALGPTNETFVSGVTKSLHHLSLGVVDLRPTPESQDPTESPATVNDPNVASAEVEEGNVADPTTSNAASTSESAIFKGYVAESTDVRLNLNRVALGTWKASPARIFFGVGLGGAGTAMYEFAPQSVGSPKEIVQNQGFSLLLELGIVGILLIVFELIVIFTPQLLPRRFIDGRAAATGQVGAFWQSSLLPLLLSLLAAYFVTLNFFSGLPNALQIYLMPPLLYLWGKVSKNRPKLS